MRIVHGSILPSDALEIDYAIACHAMYYTIACHAMYYTIAGHAMYYWSPPSHLPCHVTCMPHAPWHAPCTRQQELIFLVFDPPLCQIETPRSNSLIHQSTHQSMPINDFFAYLHQGSCDLACSTYTWHACAVSLHQGSYPDLANHHSKY